ncbi:MAG: glycosyltransferase family 4 protein [Candidatus Latescibacteria bacterium]|nr:glycosyltransferase family 4 protein [Candidatus Latescibacterota bacterium]
MSKIRVLNIITRLERGGAPQALLETIRPMSEEFDIDLVTGQTEDADLDLTQEVIDSGLPLIQVPSMRRSPHPLRDFEALRHLIRIMQKGNYDIVHTHTSKAGFLGRVAAKYCKISTVIHSPHGTILEGYFSSLITQVYVYLERITAPIAKCIICLTTREIDQYLDAKIGRREQYTHIFNGIDIGAFSTVTQTRQDVRQSLGISPESVVCITVGRLVPVKGQSDLIDALPMVLEKHPDTHLLIVGEGELRDPLVQQTQHLNLENHVHFLGWRNDIPNLLGASDIFALPSLNEGLGLVLIEAMAQHLPNIATLVGGVAEVVLQGETGLLVPAQSASKMAEALKDLIANPTKRKEMGEAGYQRALEHFSIQSTVAKTSDIYRQLIGEKA